MHSNIATTFITMVSIIEMVGTSSDNEPLGSGNVEVHHDLEALKFFLQYW